MSDLSEFARQLERELNVARAEIAGLENKWKCAVEMAARSEVERDEALAERDRQYEANAGLIAAQAKAENERDEAREALREMLATLVAEGPNEGNIICDSRDIARWRKAAGLEQ